MDSKWGSDQEELVMFGAIFAGIEQYTVGVHSICTLNVCSMPADIHVMRFTRRGLRLYDVRQGLWRLTYEWHLTMCISFVSSPHNPTKLGFFLFYLEAHWVTWQLPKGNMFHVQMMLLGWQVQPIWLAVWLDVK